jgi:hypothetical protein
MPKGKKQDKNKTRRGYHDKNKQQKDKRIKTKDKKNM